MKKNNGQKDITLMLVECGMLAALGVVLMLTVRFWLIPGAKFLEYDMGDIPVIITTLFFGPGAGMITLTFIAAIQSLTVSAASSWQGFLMHIFSTGAFICVMSFLYRRKKTTGSLLFSLIAGAICMALIMIPLNLILTPMYLNVPVQAVKELMLPAIIPFNLVKGAINCAVSFLLFTPLKKILTMAHLLPSNR